MEADTILSVSHFVHLVATVIWLGGLAIFTVLVWPEAHRHIDDSNQRRHLLFTLQKRFRPLANLSLVLLLGTGMVQMSADPNYDGFLAFTNTWTIAMLLKHLAFGGMVVLVAIIQFGLVPAIERAVLLASQGKTSELEALQHREAYLMKVILGLGIMVLAFTAVATAI